jgi:hypothetical protein
MLGSWVMSTPLGDRIAVGIRALPRAEEWTLRS